MKQMSNLPPDVMLDHIPSVGECRKLRARFKQQGAWPKVWRVKKNSKYIELLHIGHNGPKVVRL